MGPDRDRDRREARVTGADFAELFGRFRGGDGQTLRERARHRRRHPHLNDLGARPVPVVNDVQGYFYVSVYDVDSRYFRRAQIMR